jgi:hypothetical protein
MGDATIIDWLCYAAGALGLRLGAAGHVGLLPIRGQHAVGHPP